MIKYQDLFHRTDRARDALLRQILLLQEPTVSAIPVVDLFALAKRSYSYRYFRGIHIMLRRNRSAQSPCQYLYW
jgi:hypothetical protein